MTPVDPGNAYATAAAPGRVNLLGEHTDYNDGFVLPIAIQQRTHVSMRLSGRSVFTLRSSNLDRSVEFTLDSEPHEQFGKYVYGCLLMARSIAADIPFLEIEVTSNVPIGVGLSSSAALEVA